MKKLRYTIAVLILGLALNLNAQDCSSCDAYLSGSTTGNVTVPIGQVWCINGVAFTNFHTLTINGTLRSCGSTDFQSVNTVVVNAGGVIDIRDCPVRVAFSGWKTSNSDNPLVYDCSIGACGTNGSNTVWNSGSGSTVNQCNTVLPITLLEFKGEESNENITLSWITTEELNNDFFTIERSHDAEFFIEIGRLQGAGTSLNQLSYSLIDNNPLEGVNYYRLKQTDYNGDFSYSKIIAVTNVETKEVQAYPNPANHTITIKFPNVSEKSAPIEYIQLFDYQYMKQEIEIAKTTNHTYTIDVSSIPSGFYFVEYYEEGLPVRVPISILH